MKPEPAFHVPRVKCERKLADKGDFAPRSFRWVHKGRGYVLVGCPKGSWMPRAKRCKVGLRAYAVSTKATGGRCRAGSTRTRRR